MKRFLLTGLVVLGGASSALAGSVAWTDWTSQTTPTTILGTLDDQGSSVGVTYEGQRVFAQITGGGTNFWIPEAPYLSPTVDNSPAASTDIIAMSAAGLRTVTFSQPVANPILAFVSVNANSWDFTDDFEVVSFGAGFWGGSTLVSKSIVGGSHPFRLSGDGEPHGVIQFYGTLNSINWRVNANENWNGFTIGVAAAPIPEPSSFALFGLAAAGLVARRRRTR